MYLTIIALPLIGAVSTLLFGRNLGTKGAGIITTGGLALSSILSLLIFYEVGLSGSPVYIKAWT